MKAIFILLTAVLPVIGAPTEPGESAIAFLEKVRADSIDLSPGTDTALTPQTSRKKRRNIERQLDRMARDLGSGTLELGAVKQDGELAAVIVRKTGGFDPSHLQTFPVALVKRGTEWLAAPVPASFENAGVRYASHLKARLESLENWMLRERVLDLDTLRQQSASRMREKIAEFVTAEELQKINSEETAARFLNACETRNFPEILGLLGGLSDPLPRDWPLRLRAVDRALSHSPETHPAWKLLTSPNSLRALVSHEQSDDWAAISIACLNPEPNPQDESRNRIELVHLELSRRSDGHWRIDPPQSLLNGSTELESPADEDLDADLLNAFPAKISALHPPVPHSSADQARQALLAALLKEDFAPVMRLTRLDSDPQSARIACLAAARLWWKLHDPSAIQRPIPLSIREDAGTACASVQLFTPAHPDQLHLSFLYFEKSADGWHWSPAPPSNTKAVFQDWRDQQSLEWKDNWLSELLANSPVLESLEGLTSPTEEETRNLIESWLTAIRENNIEAALRLTARLDQPDSPATLIRNLGYEINTPRLGAEAATIATIRLGKTWSTAAVVTRAENKASFPFYPVLKTSSGPRILLEADLFTPPKNTRDFLNNETFVRLRKFDIQAAAELLDLFSKEQESNSKASKP